MVSSDPTLHQLITNVPPQHSLLHLIEVFVYTHNQMPVTNIQNESDFDQKNEHNANKMTNIEIQMIVYLSVTFFTNFCTEDGDCVRLFDGDMLGFFDGDVDGFFDGAFVGLSDGDCVSVASCTPPSTPFMATTSPVLSICTNVVFALGIKLISVHLCVPYLSIASK